MAPITNFEHEKEELQFKIFPNPANTWLTVVLPESDEQLMIILTDLTGKVINRKLPNQSIFIIDTDQMSNGSYLITVTNVSGTETFGTQKVVIHH